jgi:hypothetical protein
MRPNIAARWDEIMTNKESDSIAAMRRRALLRSVERV